MRVEDGSVSELFAIVEDREYEAIDGREIDLAIDAVLDKPSGDVLGRCLAEDADEGEEAINHDVFSREDDFDGEISCVDGVEFVTDSDKATDVDVTAGDVATLEVVVSATVFLE